MKTYVLILCLISLISSALASEQQQAQPSLNEGELFLKEILLLSASTGHPLYSINKTNFVQIDVARTKILINADLIDQKGNKKTCNSTVAIDELDLNNVKLTFDCIGEQPHTETYDGFIDFDVVINSMAGKEKNFSVANQVGKFFIGIFNFLFTKICMLLKSITRNPNLCT